MKIFKLSCQYSNFCLKIKVLSNSVFSYPNYEVFADTSIAQNAQVNSRYTDASLYGVITDIQMLSKCDYLVCTFSSNVRIKNSKSLSDKNFGPFSIQMTLRGSNQVPINC